ncbi:acetyl-CoA carboxylase biotin carboxyl carrier protein [Evansella sp. LMS18]|jgi:acetyl-CoA carboxylase biotin carboxyl carrier protein|uniref:acetyl-CoA carboxylase biotin carboxyl carrier protein n=1 Tax=Evansella sp. LMS18 TaxID=2924033 RepID=UPI0020D1ECA7|nr:acetyl-CoA carboxylase biotin carboxyl carrier protein [Evansella sp. LMS18]UTR09469.1 acetyl-CoA carboxylase biotin carboxyl carrier protein [Evansella sp. LMS18]
MLKIQEIRELIKLIDQSSIEEFDFEQNGAKVSMKKQSAGGTVQAAVQSAPAAAPAVQGDKQETVRENNTAPAVAEAAVKEEQQPAPVNNTRSEELHTITSPMVGTFYQAPSPDSPPYVKTGDKVNEESVVCIVEAMKLMNEIEAEVKGEIVEVLAENGQLVEYGQELFLVKPE